MGCAISKPKNEIALIGLPMAGKKTFLKTIATSTISFFDHHSNGELVYGLQYRNLELVSFDISATNPDLSKWRQFFISDCKSIIFVVESHRASIESAKMIYDMIRSLTSLPIVIAANKQDLPDAMIAPEIGEYFSIREHNTTIQPSCTSTGDGVIEILEYIRKHIK
ncbi:Small GTPase superfamily, ARF/SAR type like protein [Aduncisulcus paluster]|uniref:Small GTPase superfamily, ARF/SAR type like protein n=1 Tax=Aduncisulcus paluster TaxID=2918883 RepID=A0ABQ5KM19_9EUKA|nr:Small GTPase superfamily, ARF/SAR type like protein [Aduncisulcus paluster]